MARREERHIEDEAKRRRSGGMGMGNEVMLAVESGYAQVGGSSSSSGADQADSEQSQRRQDVSDAGNQDVQVEKRGKDHSWVDIRSQEKRMRLDDGAMQPADDMSVLDRIATEYDISELRDQTA